MLKPKPNYRANVGTFFEKAKFNFKNAIIRGTCTFFIRRRHRSLRLHSAL